MRDTGGVKRMIDDCVKRYGMSRTGMALAALMVFGYLGIQTHQTVTEADSWPFSSFPMYSWKQPKVQGLTRLVGVSSGGEFDLKKKYTRPLSGARLRWVVNSMKGKRGRKAFDAFLKRYEERRRAADEEWPVLHALRRYQLSWRIRPNLAGLDETKRRLTTAVLALEPAREKRLKREAKGKAPPVAAQPANEGDVVLLASDAQVRGKVTLEDDRNAFLGKALKFTGEQSSKKPKKSPEDAALFEFDAPPGRYWVWLRGKANKNSKRDSVWLQVDRQLGTTKSSASKGFGNYRSGYPKNAFAWSSGAPAHKPVRIKLDGNHHKLLVSTRESPVWIDQIVLSKSWSELPLEDGPIKK